MGRLEYNKYNRNKINAGISAASFSLKIASIGRIKQKIHIVNIVK